MSNNAAATNLLNATAPDFRNTSRIVLELEEKGEVVNVLLSPEECIQLNQSPGPTTKAANEEGSNSKGGAVVGNNNSNNNPSTAATNFMLQYNVSFTSIILLDPNNNIFLVKHRSGEWTPPGGKIEPNENSFEAAMREYAEETGVSFDSLLSNGVLDSIGVFAYFHPESARKSTVRDSKNTITLNHVFRANAELTAQELFDQEKVKTGELGACFYPLPEIADRDTLPVRACPLASLLASFGDLFDANAHEKGQSVVGKWHAYRASQFVGNVLDEAPKHNRWIWKK